MKSKLLCAVAGLFAAGLLLLAGCFNPLGGDTEAGSEELGAVVLVFEDVRAKTLVPEISLEIFRYEASFERTGFLPVLVTDIPGEAAETEPVSLLPGPWEVTVTAFNEAGDVIGVGSDEVQVRARQTSRVSMFIRSLSGTGTLSLSADLSELELLSPAISGTLTSGATDQITPIELTIEGPSGLFEGSFDLEAGTYLLSLELAESETVIARYVDTALIVHEEITEGALVFRPVGGSVVAELVDEITRPIAITLEGLEESLGSEESMTVTASTAVEVDSYRWYLDGEELDGEESSELTLGPGLEEASYLLTVVVRKGAIYSSQQGEFSVGAPVPVVPVDGVSVAPDSVTLEVGESETLTATVSPSNATNRNVSWSSDDETVATVATIGAGALVTAVSPGTAVITVASEEDGGYTDTCVVEVTVEEVGTIVKISAGGSHTMFLTDDGTLWATGYNSNGQLGTGDTENRWSFEQVASDVLAVSAGENHTIVLKINGTLWATGYNSNGQLGTGDTDDRWSFEQVASASDNNVAVSAGSRHTMLLKSDGTLWASGANSQGQLGTGDTDQRLSFEHVAWASDNNVAVSAGSTHTMLLKGDGTLWATGGNPSGQLGTGYMESEVGFVEVAGAFSDNVAVSAGEDHTMLLKSDGTLWATGGNIYGQLGIGVSNDRWSFEQVVSASNDNVAVSAGTRHTMLLKIDGSVWGTGDCRYGQLGINQSGVSCYFEQATLTGNDNIVVSAGEYHTMLLKSDGSLWGTGAGGSLGMGWPWYDLDIFEQVWP